MTENELDDALSEPTPGVVATLGEREGPLLVLGAAGKMGPSLTRMAQRAVGHKRRVVAVSRFSTPSSRAFFTDHGIETIAADLLSPDALAGLPDADDVVYMAGMKFGATGNAPLTWAMNTLLPGLVARRYRTSRIAAFSTGNVYPLTPLALGGSVESDPPGPVGEYAQSCLGRERLFEHASTEFGTLVTILRLNYAVELRYGVLVDLATRLLADEPIPLAMGAVNVVWQGDANAWALQSLSTARSPAAVYNLAGPEQLSVRRLAETLGILLGKTPRFVGEESPTALLSNGQKAHAHFGYPRVPIQTLLDWTAAWVQNGRPSLGKPTKFEVQDGRF